MPTNIINWRDPGHNVWGFQHVSGILQTEPIRKCTEPSTLTSNHLVFEEFKLDNAAGSSLDLPSFLSQTETDGLIVLKDGAVVYEYYGRTNSSASIHATFSISKPITGLLCGILEADNKLSVNDLVSRYVPEVEGSAYEKVTVRQLLDMRSGVIHDDASVGYRNATGFYPLKSDEQPTDLHEYIPTIRPVQTAPVDGLDGPRYEYLSPNADLLGWVLERASGKKFADLMTEYLWQPMGAESNAYVAVDRSGNARAAAGLCATIRDIARIGQMVLEGGQSIVPKTWIDDIHSNGSQDAFAAGSEITEYRRLFDSVAYRSYWIVDRSSPFLMASGTNGQILLIDCRNSIVMAKTSSQPARTDWEKIRLTMQAFKEFTKIAMGDMNDDAGRQK